MSAGFLLERPEQHYVARFGIATQLTEHQIDGYVDGLIEGRGTDRLEQIITASYEAATVISERLSGETVQTLGFEGIAGATDGQIASFIRLMEEANDKSLDLDTTEGNILYDEDDGFGIIDYGKNPQFRTNRLAEYASFAAYSLLGDEVERITIEDFERGRVETAEQLAFLHRFEDISHQVMPPADAARLNFTGKYAMLERQHYDYGDAEWVAARAKP